ncbi:MAG: NTP transferase domain-containing protein [Candidatus Omnitrophica bacterium]|nr:NTP transferase domain-containing protein [Candidatus Omnitrophota bacterium]
MRRDIQENILGLVLAGGKSSRMGKDKALLKYKGEIQLKRSFDLLSRFCEKVFVSVNHRQAKLSFYDKFPIIPDAYKNIGPLGGIMSAFKEYPKANWLILACDLPFVKDKTINNLLIKRDPNKSATCYKSAYDLLPEPLCAIYENNILAHLKCFRKKGITCPRKILMQMDVKMLKLNNKKELDNINTFAEYKNVISTHK